MPSCPLKPYSVSIKPRIEDTSHSGGNASLLDFHKWDFSGCFTQNSSTFAALLREHQGPKDLSSMGTWVAFRTEPTSVKPPLGQLRAEGSIYHANASRRHTAVHVGCLHGLPEMPLSWGTAAAHLLLWARPQLSQPRCWSNRPGSKGWGIFSEFYTNF